MTGGPFEIRPALTSDDGDGEDYAVVVTVDGSGDLEGTWVLKLWAADGTEITDGVSCSITDASAREVTGVIAGLDLDPGVYRWAVRRTDAGFRVWSAWGTLVVDNLNRV